MRFKGANSEHAKRQNMRVTLEVIYRHGPISRNEVAERTQLTPQTVSNIVSELVPYSLIKENKVLTGKKGKPAKQYAIDKQGVLCIGLLINHLEVVGCLVNAVGDKLAEYAIDLENLSHEHVIEAAADVIRTIKETNDIESRRVLGVGVAMPGVFNKGVYMSVTMDNWKGYPLANILSNKVGYPVFVENDAAAAAIGEGLFGSAKGVSNFLYCYFSWMGLGGGLVINNEPYLGEHNGAAEIGHINIVNNGIECICGNFGCLEEYVSLKAAHRAVFGTTEKCSSTFEQDILDAYIAKNTLLDKWLNEASALFASALNTLQKILDLENIFFGGHLPQPVLVELIDRTENVLKANDKRTQQNIASHLNFNVVSCDVPLGAAALPLSALLMQNQKEPTLNAHIVESNAKANLYQLFSH